MESVEICWVRIHGPSLWKFVGLFLAFCVHVYIYIYKMIVVLYFLNIHKHG